MKRKLLALLIFGAYVVWGNTQERIKIDTNFLLDYAAQIPAYDTLDAAARGQAINTLAPEVPFDYYYNHQRVPFLLTLTQPQLSKFKWAFTGLGMLICLAVTWTILYLLYKGTFWRRWTLALFAGVFLLAFGVYGIGVLSGKLPQMYPAARKLMGAIQSPFAPALLAFLFRFGNFETYERNQPPA